jgi:hypothetical protein
MALQHEVSRFDGGVGLPAIRAHGGHEPGAGVTLPPSRDAEQKTAQGEGGARAPSSVKSKGPSEDGIPADPHDQGRDQYGGGGSGDGAEEL